MSHIGKIPIVCASDNNYAPYLSVLIFSIMKNANEENDYEFIILETSICEQNKDKLNLLAKSEKNLSLRFINLADIACEYNFHLGDRYTAETYYKLFLPQLLKEYSKVIWLDVDTVVLDDVAKLYNIDISEYSIGATINMENFLLFGEAEQSKEYFEKTLQLSDPAKYFQSGVLLLNLEKMRAHKEQEQLLELATKHDFRYVDQDVLNFFYKGNIKFIDQAWNVSNVMMEWTDEYIAKHFHMHQDEFNQFIIAKESPKIIHYCGPSKPWFDADVYRVSTWWKHMKLGPFYSELIVKKLTNAIRYIIEDIGKSKHVENSIEYLNDERNKLANQHYSLSQRYDHIEWHFSNLSTRYDDIKFWHDDFKSKHQEHEKTHHELVSDVSTLGRSVLEVEQMKNTLEQKHIALSKQMQDLIAVRNGLLHVRVMNFIRSKILRKKL